MEHQAKRSGDRQKKWFFLTQHWVKLELAAMACCGGRNKERVKNIRAHLRKKSPLKAVKHKDANRASGLWNQDVCCQNLWGCTLKSITGCLSCCCILALSVHYQLLLETAHWARWAFSLAEKSHFFFSVGRSTVFVGWNVLYLAAEKQENCSRYPAQWN